MKRYIYIIALLATTSLQAQTLNVNNNDGTFLPFELKEANDITFNETDKTVAVSFQNGVQHSFYTEAVESISPKTDKSNKLTYNLTPTVAFDNNDKKNFNEVVETIPTKETEDNDFGDFVEKFDIENIINIVFSENDVTVSSEDIDYTKNGTHLTINSDLSKVGYLVRGKCSNGSLKIYSEKKFQIMLCGLNLTNPKGPAINIQTGKTVYFTIDDNTTNTLCDGTSYGASPNGEDQKGTLFSEGQLIFNGYADGTGVLNVTSLGSHAICSDDYIRIRSGNINIVKALKDGFHTNDKFIVGRTANASPKITVNATNDGIDCGKGEVTINAGTIELTTGGEGIKAECETTISQNVTINGGYIKITTTGEKSSGIKSLYAYNQTGGIIHGTVQGDGSKILNCDSDVTISGGKIIGFAQGSVLDESTLAGGIKCEGVLNIQKGTIAIECSGKGAKGVNCDNITIKDGDITILSTAQNLTGTKTFPSTAIDTENLTITNGSLKLKAHDSAISAANVSITKGKLHAISDSDIAIDATVTQSGGWILTKENE